MTAGYKWRPLERVTRFKPLALELIELAMTTYGLDRDAAIRRLNDEDKCREVWANDLYQVELRRYDGGFVHLNIRRRDNAPCIRDWRHFQQIKNELIGPECEAMELYPAESRKVDASNKYHLYGVADPSFRFPVGFDKRDVQYDDTPGVPGMRQRGKTVDADDPLRPRYRAVFTELVQAGRF